MYDMPDDETSNDIEGVFDAQLLFPETAFGPPRLLTRIIKRDGREAPFDKAKIADAITRASQSTGGLDRDRADSLASAVAIFLAKQFNGAPPHVEQVNDAVERVLIELGHGEVALAYARYRDRRARIRDLRQGNLRAILHELEEAREAVPRPASNAPVFVRTGDETLVEWDAGRIVTALVRETGMDAGQARIIALEVQEQINDAHVEILTASLIRELVDIRLMKHGFEEYRRRHTRLGVPLYDAEQTICVPNRDESSRRRDPIATDIELAERVKREFALNHVYGQDEADAHRRGDICIHHAGYIDRLFACRASMAPMASLDTQEPLLWNSMRGSRRLEDLLYHLGSFSSALEAHFSGPVVWSRVNKTLASLAAVSEEAAFASFVRLFLIGLTPQRSHHQGSIPRTTLELSLLTDSCATGRSDSSGPVHDKEGLALQAASQIIGLLRRQSGETAWDSSLVISLLLSADTQESPERRAVLMQAAELAVAGYPVHIRFDRGDASLRTHSMGLDDVCLGVVGLNLPRAACAADSEELFYAELDRLAGIAVKAHCAKREFISRLLNVKAFGPLAFLATGHDGRPLFDLEQAYHGIGVSGLNECVRILTGNQMHEDPDALALGLRICHHIGYSCSRMSEREGFRICPTPSPPETASLRFPILDARIYSEKLRNVIKAHPVTQDLYYTEGVSCADDAQLIPFERIRLEASFHEIIPGVANTRISIPDGVGAESVADLIAKTSRHTACRSLECVPRTGGRPLW